MIKRPCFLPGFISSFSLGSCGNAVGASRANWVPVFVSIEHINVSTVTRTRGHGSQEEKDLDLEPERAACSQDRGSTGMS